MGVLGLPWVRGTELCVTWELLSCWCGCEVLLSLLLSTLFPV